jgi:ribonuclease HI
VGLRAWVGDLWNEKPWRTNKEYTILYREKVLELKNYLVDMIKVKGHSGVAGNEAVDKFLKT